MGAITCGIDIPPDTTISAREFQTQVGHASIAAGIPGVSVLTCNGTSVPRRKENASFLISKLKEHCGLRLYL